MREFQERRRLKRLLHSRYAIGALAVVLLLVLRGVWGVYVKYEKSKELSARMASEASALQEREDALKASIDSLSTPEGREREMRDRFGVVKPGEKMVVLVNPQPSGDTAPAPEPRGFWSRLVGLFGF